MTSSANLEADDVADLEDSSITNLCDLHNANHSSQCYGHTSEMHHSGLNVESEPEQPIHMDTFVEHLPEFVEEGTLDDNALFDDDLLFDDDPSFEDSLELNQEEGTEPKSSTNTGDHPLYRNAPISVAESSPHNDFCKKTQNNRKSSK